MFVVNNNSLSVTFLLSSLTDVSQKMEDLLGCFMYLFFFNIGTYFGGVFRCVNLCLMCFVNILSFAFGYLHLCFPSFQIRVSSHPFVLFF